MIRVVHLGIDYAGLTTVGYRLVASDGTEAAARTTAGVYPLGGGAYAADVTVSDGFDGSIVWDADAGSDAVAAESWRSTETIDGLTLEAAVRVILAAVAGSLTGAATSLIEIAAAGGGKVRLRAAVDADGNRTVILVDGSA